MTGIINAFALDVGYAGSAWNPADTYYTNDDPLTFSNSNRTTTRTNAVPNQSDGGVRGTVQRGVAAMKRYLELVADSSGTNPFSSAYWSAGLVGVMTVGGDSDPTNDGGSYLIVYGNGSIYKTGLTPDGMLGASLVAGDIIGLAWEYGVGIDIYINNTLEKAAAFTDAVMLYPFFGAGSTLVGGPALTGSGEACTLNTSAADLVYTPPTGFIAWD